MKSRRFSQNDVLIRVQRRGIALIIVLASLVLLTLLVVAFLSNVGSELKTSKIYANGASVKLLAQSAVNLVQTEINDATHDGALCWTSQPGMIRTFDTAGNSAKFYKLYSDDTMVGSAFTSATPPIDWYKNTGVYVDLNQPVTINGTKHYPIIDGDSADYLATASGTVDTSTGIPNGASILGPVYTDTAGKKQAQVAGFWLKDAPLQPSSPNVAPMPVKWLYVLRDGSFVAPDSTVTAGNTTFVNAGAAQMPDKDSKQIVGRIAFWTDDDTSKVNVNTAGEGVAVWDTPRYLVSDINLALSQPVQNEFQRYPGHPSTVALSSVFGNLVTDGTSYPENIYPLTPRVQSGGSLHGTVSLRLYDAVSDTYSYNSALKDLSLRTDRLLDTVDEFMFQSTVASNKRLLNSALLSSTSSLDQAKIEKAKFFLTASSRAPDVNLFNRPRVSMWPVSSVSKVLPNRSPKDQLIAFCTTVNNYEYFFQRLDPNDPTTDLPGSKASDGTDTGLGHNRQLMEYLRDLMSKPIPGFGGSFASKYNSGDVLPGSSGITGKESDQILTEIFDYIRCTNLKDQSIAVITGTPQSPIVTNPVTTYTSGLASPQPSNYVYAGGGSGQVVPIVDQNTGTRGFGRFPTIQQAALIFYASKDDNGKPASVVPPVAAAPPAASQAKAFFVLQLFDPAMGYPWALPYYRIRVTGLGTSGSFLWDSAISTSQMFASNTAILPSPVDNGFNLHPMAGGVVGWRRVMQGATDTSAVWGPLFSTGYPADADNPSNLSYAAAIPAGLGKTKINFKGGNVKVEICQNLPDGSVGTVLQTVNLNFPDGTFPLPAIPPSGTVPTALPPLPSHVPVPIYTTGINKKATVPPSWSTLGWELWSNRWGSQAENQFGEILSSNDVIRSVVASPGDVRLIAARQTIDTTATASLFAKHPVYSDQTQNLAYNLQTSMGDPEFHASMTSTGGGGRLVNNITYWGWYSGWNTNTGGVEYQSMGKMAMWSDVPTSTGVFVGGSGSIPGDWDNGLPIYKDGPYINKPDEGDDTIFKQYGSTPYFGAYSATSIGQTFFSPNRMLPSSGMLGSLPTGVLANKPWQTLLFRPGPAGHPGLGSSSAASGDVGPPYKTPPDHLLMDLFTMPVVEPYAISEPLSTAGRINMNYQILPFSYINRKTGIIAALKSTKVIAVPDGDIFTGAGQQFHIYKDQSGYSPGPTTTYTYRMDVNMQKTLAQFDYRFGQNDVFRSATEICGIDLVPDDPKVTISLTIPASPSSTRTTMDTYWLTHRLTGDNTRERPYANLYPLLTTKSNTYTIHFRVQTLKKVVSGSTNYAQWREDTDLVTGEYRGSQTVERYVDANNAVDASGTLLPNFASAANLPKDLTLAPYYKFRVIATRQFAP